MRLALEIENIGRIGNNPATRFDPGSTDIGKVITDFGQVAIFVGGFLMFFWAAWGVYDYIRAEGNKEALVKARKRIQWAITGFIILLLAFFMSGFVQEFLQPQDVPVEELTN